MTLIICCDKKFTIAAPLHYPHLLFNNEITLTTTYQQLNNYVYKNNLRLTSFVGLNKKDNAKFKITHAMQLVKTQYSHSKNLESIMLQFIEQNFVERLKD